VTSVSSPFENLSRQGMLRPEAPDASEYEGLVRSGRIRKARGWSPATPVTE
jgi:hypothetical protein